MLERKGRRVVLRCEEAEAQMPRAIPDYASVLHAPDIDAADAWTRSWEETSDELVPVEEREEQA